MPGHATGIGVHLIIRMHHTVLLGLRTPATGWADGQWHLPSGHLEPGEDVLAAAVREADEELGIRIPRQALTLAHVLHDLDADDHRDRLQLFFEVGDYTGPIRNREPDKCADLLWWPQDDLPDPTVAYAAHALHAIAAGQRCSARGWPQSTPTQS
ncbi:hypothetical protein BIV57_10830 [Mangrovactinospora gilvigrisea]|uniref:Nudix hydrolase domain-containing protein n=1 Tax=Mangrovactinospora gilvigrisea TaxID=1428644 RepID=A0A1J7BFH7_9ACTN|nr:NUDIX domain-containing protein [Mangrovactinospora gilvigrisea]OIV37455.1 hypothetical protein BIV57_10830 [Mangrovactinospora gilvigrisea]